MVEKIQGQKLTANNLPAYGGGLYPIFFGPCLYNRKGTTIIKRRAKMHPILDKFKGAQELTRLGSAHEILFWMRKYEYIPYTYTI